MADGIVTIMDENDKSALETKIDNLTSEDVGAVAKTGDTMTGPLRIEDGTYPKLRVKATNSNGISAVEGSSTGIGLIAIDDESNTTTFRGLYLRDSETCEVKDSLMLMDRVDGVDTKYMIYGMHNKPSAAAIQSGYFGGKVMANQEACTDVNASQVRNIYAGTTKFTHGVTSMLDGYIYLQYK